MQEFSFRTLLIFLICLVAAVLLIGLGVAGVVKFKQRDVSEDSANTPRQPMQTAGDVRALSIGTGLAKNPPLA